MKTPIGADPNNAKAVVDEANNGLKAVPVELVTKAADDSTFTQVGASNPLQVSGNVTLTGSILTKATPIPTYRTGGSITVDTVINAQSVTAGGNLSFNLNPTTEKEIWVAVNIDQQPWSLFSNTLFYAGSDGSSDSFFPKRSSVVTTYSNSLSPVISFFVGEVNFTGSALTAPTSLSEAKNSKLPYQSTAKGRISNGSANTATVTVRIIRVWGD